MAQVPTASTCTSKAHGKRCRVPRRGWTLAVPDRQSSWDGGATARLTYVRHGSCRRWSHSSLIPFGVKNSAISAMDDDLGSVGEEHFCREQGGLCEGDPPGLSKWLPPVVWLKL